MKISESRNQALNLLVNLSNMCSAQFEEEELAVNLIEEVIKKSDKIGEFIVFDYSGEQHSLSQLSNPLSFDRAINFSKNKKETTVVMKKIHYNYNKK